LETNVRMSHLEAVVVSVGAALFGHFTLVKVPVNEPAPVLTIKINDLPATAVGMVNVQLPVRVTVCKVPLARESVCAVPELPIATTPSVYEPEKFTLWAVSIVIAVVPADFKSNDVAAAEVTKGVVTLVFAVTVVNVPAAAAVPPMAGGLARYVLNPVPETVLLALNVVNEPAAAAVPPMAGGLARYVLNPVPETVLDADNVVNAPVDAVVAPIDMLLMVPMPVEVSASVGVVLAVSVIKFVYAAPSVS
jgi:hypothetical protein